MAVRDDIPDISVHQHLHSVSFAFDPDYAVAFGGNAVYLQVNDKLLLALLEAVWRGLQDRIIYDKTPYTGPERRRRPHPVVASNPVPDRPL